VRRWLPLLLLSTVGCSEDLLDPGRARLEPGHEPDPWTESPAPTRGRVEKELADGSRSVIVDGPAPVREFSLGEGGVGRFVVSGDDADGVTRVRARSLPVSPAGLASSILPLFVSRTGTFARPPGELVTDQGERPPAAVVAGRYVVFAGGASGDRVALDGYDLGAWSPLQPPPSMGCPTAPCEITSLAVVSGTLSLAIGSDWAIWFDLDAGTSGDVARPDGLASWADVAGGSTVLTPSGEAYVVGATRMDAPSQAVVRIDADGVLSYVALVTPRRGAAATWVTGRGLVVVGGAGGSAAGAELMADGANAFTVLPYPSDETTGSALVARDGSRVLRVGGRDAASSPAPSVELDLGCGTGCQPTPAGADVALDRAAAFSVAEGHVLVVGDDADGNTSAALLDGTSATPVPLRDPRKGATALALPTGHVGVVGGIGGDGAGVGSVELYIE